ncbi:hypothetical protein [Carboxylicivirga marina]|uniref:Bacteriocin n=1 Tax=Carboxylicivirga marina TaxID=2800988 RepID=A0ABS1HKD3_9BACT|nr:hypothetical protein [Carboxylicivirga marina]MBK3517738.1 hypothetical protein [Carboxylicivirga marina]
MKNLKEIGLKELDNVQLKKMNGGGFWEDARDGYCDCLVGKTPDFEDRSITYWVFHGLANGLKGAVEN